jgi:hypothetical protein
MKPRVSRGTARPQVVKARTKQTFNQKPGLNEEQSLQVGLSAVNGLPEGIVYPQRAGEA